MVSFGNGGELGEGGIDSWLGIRVSLPPRIFSLTFKGSYEFLVAVALPYPELFPPQEVMSWFVIPSKADIQADGEKNNLKDLDSRLRGNDLILGASRRHMVRTSDDLKGTRGDAGYFTTFL